MDKKEEKKEKFDFNLGTWHLVLLGLFALLVVYNQIQIYQVSGMATSNVNSNFNSNPTESIIEVGASDVIPKGIPEIYGEELGISYNDVSANDPQKADQTISVLGNLDRTLTLEGNNLQRYISIAGQISCEYCCGAPSIIFTKDTGQYKAGDAACGCAHSYAMRGLAKYLILNHGSEFTDDQILEEMGKWKTLFFPGVMQSKADVLEQKNIEFNYVNLASNKYRGIEQGASSSGSMVGGC